jgi:hypothetical protein
VNVNTMFPSKYLRGAELTAPVTVTIARVVQETMYKPGAGTVAGWVLYCEKASRGVVLTRPLALGIAQALGDPDTDNWTGKQVTLYPQAMTVAGVPRVAIRARAANGKAQEVQP